MSFIEFHPRTCFGASDGAIASSDDDDDAAVFGVHPDIIQGVVAPDPMPFTMFKNAPFPNVIDQQKPHLHPQPPEVPPPPLPEVSPPPWHQIHLSQPEAPQPGGDPPGDDLPVNHQSGSSQDTPPSLLQGIRSAFNRLREAGVFEYGDYTDGHAEAGAHASGGDSIGSASGGDSNGSAQGGDSSGSASGGDSSGTASGGDSNGSAQGDGSTGSAWGEWSYLPEQIKANLLMVCEILTLLFVLFHGGDHFTEKDAKRIANRTIFITDEHRELKDADKLDDLLEKAIKDMKSDKVPIMHDYVVHDRRLYVVFEVIGDSVRLLSQNKITNGAYDWVMKDGKAFQVPIASVKVVLRNKDLTFESADVKVPECESDEMDDDDEGGDAGPPDDDAGSPNDAGDLPYVQRKSVTEPGKTKSVPKMNGSEESKSTVDRYMQVYTYEFFGDGVKDLVYAQVCVCLS